MNDIASVSKTTLKNVLLITLRHHEDHRGTYTQLFNESEYAKIIRKHTRQKVTFLHDDMACSSKNVLRGIHGDSRTWKLVSCLQGKLYLVVVDCNASSKTFGKWEKFILTKENGKQLLVPPSYGLAYLVLSDTGIFHYKQSAYYRGKSAQFTYRWDDPRFKIWWPIKEPILSQRDALAHDIQK